LGLLLGFSPSFLLLLGASGLLLLLLLEDGCMQLAQEFAPGGSCLRHASILLASPLELCMNLPPLKVAVLRGREYVNYLWLDTYCEGPRHLIFTCKTTKRKTILLIEEHASNNINRREMSMHPIKGRTNTARNLSCDINV
jgi:hypothetical protein